MFLEGFEKKNLRINVEIGLELDFYVEILEILLWKKM